MTKSKLLLKSWNYVSQIEDNKWKLSKLKTTITQVKIDSYDKKAELWQKYEIH